MRKILSLVIVLFVVEINSYCEDFQAMLSEVDKLVNYPSNDFQARYTIVQDLPGEGRITTVASVFRRDAEEAYTIVIEEPLENRGQGYLKQGKTLWIYDPESRQFNSTSSSEKFQNTNARNSDFTRSTLAEDYRVTGWEMVKLGIYNCWLLDLEGRTQDLTYPRMRIWIDEKNLVRKTEDYSLSGEMLRSSVIPSYFELDGLFVPNKILYVDQLEGAVINGKFQNQKTQITIENPTLAKLPDSVFSKSFLERVSR